MSLLKSIFGPSKDDIWQQVAQDIGGDFSNGGFWGKDVLRYQSGEWEILLDTYTVSTGKSSTTYTRMRAPFINKDGFYFNIYRSSIFSGLGKFFGMQDIEIGEPLFDDQFIIKGNDEDRVRLLLDDDELKRLLNLEPQVAFKISDDEGFFAQTYPDGVDLLQFRCHGVIRDTHRIKNLFEIFSCLLTRLVHIDSAYADDPEITLK